VSNSAYSSSPEASRARSLSLREAERRSNLPPDKADALAGGRLLRRYASRNDRGSVAPRVRQSIRRPVLVSCRSGAGMIDCRRIVDWRQGGSTATQQRGGSHLLLVKQARFFDADQRQMHAKHADGHRLDEPSRIVIAADSPCPAGNRANGKPPVISSGPFACFACICTLFALETSFLPDYFIAFG
jgi:hypothetical protein